MSQNILTNAFATYKAQQEAAGNPIEMDEFVFALVPGLDPDIPIDPNEVLPPDNQIQGRYPVTRKAMLNPDAVVYSIVLGTDIGTFEFNWVGLVNSTTNMTGAIIHTVQQTKVAADPIASIEGDTLTRNIVTPYTNAAELTQIFVNADVWQLDFNSRLYAMDDRVRQINMINYGKSAFIGEGWKITSAAMATSAVAAPGTGFVGGLEAVNQASTLIDLMGVSIPTSIYLITSFQGTVSSAWEVVTELRAVNTLPDSWVENGITFYAAEISQLTILNGSVDVRDIDWRTDHLDTTKNPHPQYYQAAYATADTNGLVELATQAEVDAGIDTSRAVTPATLKGAVPDASTTVKGKIEIATQAEVDTGTDLSRAVTPALLKHAIDNVPNASTTVKGKIEIATQAEVDTGTDLSRAVTPALLKHAIDNVPNASTTVKGKIEIATQTEVNTGTDTSRAITPALLKFAIDNVPNASTTVKGKIEIATQSEVNSGASSYLAVTPATLKSYSFSSSQISGLDVALYRIKVNSSDTKPDYISNKITSSNGSITISYGSGVNGGYINFQTKLASQSLAEGGADNNVSMSAWGVNKYYTKRQYVGVSLPSTSSDPVGTVYYLY